MTKTLIQRINDLLRTASEHGHLDLLAEDVHPDEINAICDEVKAMADAETAAEEATGSLVDRIERAKEDASDLADSRK